MTKEEKEIDDIVKLLDQFSMAEESRMKIKTSNEIPTGAVQKTHHHGRCDIGSPFACGTAFDVIEIENIHS